MPWIHVKTVAPKGEARETWLSFPRNVAAVRDDGIGQFDDFQAGVRYEYDPRQKKLLRLSATTGAAKELGMTAGLFRAILRGDGISNDQHSLPLQIVRQRQRTVTEEGRQWIVYELELQPGDPDKHEARNLASMTIHVDRKTMLPERITLTRPKAELQMLIDYPATGPADIYALGVPRDAPVDDRTPPPDLNRILAIVARNRRTFDDCLAVAGDQSNDISVHVVRRKGEKLRADTYLKEFYLPQPNTQKMKRVGKFVDFASAADVAQWWRQYGKQIQSASVLSGFVLYDGRDVYSFDYSSPSGWKVDRRFSWNGQASAAEASGNLSAVYGRTARVPADAFAGEPLLGIVSDSSSGPKRRKRPRRQRSRGTTHRQSRRAER